jgi:Uma2 family endonuclease
MTTVGLLTAEEFARLPEERDRHSELVRGVIVRVTPPRFRHGYVASNFGFALQQFTRPRELGWVVCNDSGVITERDPDTVRGPDIAYFSYQRLPRDAEVDLYPPVLPDLAVEIKSPRDRWADIHAKVAEYLAAGVTVVCVVDYELRTVSLFYVDKPSITLNENDNLTLPEVLPGFCIPVRQLFE